MPTRSEAREWVESLFSAWEEGDPDKAAELFSEEARYHSHPFRPPMSGRSTIAEYWRRAVATQSDLKFTIGSPILDGDRVAVEWWVSLHEDGHDSTSTGTLFLTYDQGGLCTLLREVWVEEPGRRPPYQGWGT